jgi:hypothetical protein
VTAQTDGDGLDQLGVLGDHEYPHVGLPPRTKTRADVAVGAATRVDGGRLGRLGVLVDDEQVPRDAAPHGKPRFGLLSVGC